MATQLQRSERDPQRIVDAIIQLTEGRQNSVGDVSLAVGQTSTVVSFPNCSKDSRVFLGGLNAAAVAAAPQVVVADIRQRSFTIRHAAAGAGASLSFVCIGG